MTNEAAFAMQVASRRETKGLNRKDMETLLRTSRELWGDAPQEQGIKCNPWGAWQVVISTNLRFDTRSGSFADLAGQAGGRIGRMVGGTLDVRDAQSLAEEYLERGSKALSGLPARYRGRVVEYILDLEEQRTEGPECESLSSRREDRQRELVNEMSGKPTPRGR